MSTCPRKTDSAVPHLLLLATLTTGDINVFLHGHGRYCFALSIAAGYQGERLAIARHEERRHESVMSRRRETKGERYVCLYHGAGSPTSSLCLLSMEVILMYGEFSLVPNAQNSAAGKVWYLLS